MDNIKKHNPKAKVIKGLSEVTTDNAALIRGKKVLLVEDGPTLTHGGMSFGAGAVAAKQFKAAKVVDPKKYTVGSIKAAYKKYPQLGALIPALGYYPQQLKDLERSIKQTPCDTVVVASPIDIRRVIKLDKPSVRVRYELKEKGKPTLKEILSAF